MGIHWRSPALSFIFLLAWVPGLQASVEVSRVRPTGGSFAGGTRMVISGSGFSSGTGPGNVVTIGGLPCIPIPLHCTVAQVICKVQPLPPKYSWNEQGGDSGILPVQVSVGGEVSVCSDLSANGCSFRFAQVRSPSSIAIAPLHFFHPPAVCLH
jgi:hypothetical protein